MYYEIASMEDVQSDYYFEIAFMKHGIGYRVCGITKAVGGGSNIYSKYFDDKKEAKAFYFKMAEIIIDGDYSKEDRIKFFD